MCARERTAKVTADACRERDGVAIVIVEGDDRYDVGVMIGG